MNIALKTFSGQVISRPDTTWEKENRDYYIPDFVNGMLWSPVLFTRVGKAGKCIGRKYADRYIDGMGFGLLLHPLVECNGEAVPSSCMDHTTILPFPLYNKVVLDTPGNEAVYLCDDVALCSFRTGAEASEVKNSGAMPLETAPAVTATEKNALEMSVPVMTVSAELIPDAICDVSRITSLRIGDIVAVELLSPAALPLSSSRTALSATFCDNGIFDFSILM